MYASSHAIFSSTFKNASRLQFTKVIDIDYETDEALAKANDVHTDAIDKAICLKSYSNAHRFSLC